MKAKNIKIFLLFLFLISIFNFVPKLLYAEFIEYRDREKTTLESARDYTEGIYHLNPDDQLPICRSIHSQVLWEINKPQVKISWIPPQVAKKEQIIVAHSYTPISTTEQFLRAETLAILSGNSSFYLQEDVLPGKHYYAVALRSKIEKQELKLYPDENYTILPLKININNNGNPTHVHNLQAKLLKNQTVRLQWKKIEDENVVYIIYRSNKPLSTSESLNNSTRIAIALDNQDSFIDRDLPSEGNFFYAVTTQGKNGAEDRNLIAKDSYTIEPIILYQQNKEEQVFSLEAQVQESSVELRWQEPSENKNIAGYLLLRSETPILKEDKNSQVQVAKLLSGASHYIDKNLKNGSYYYAVVSLQKNGQINHQFISEQNTLIEPAVIENSESQKSKIFSTESTSLSEERKIISENKIPSHKIFKHFTVFLQQGKIFLNWDIVDSALNPSNKKEIFLYRFYKKPERLQDIAMGNLIQRVPYQNGSVIDIPQQNGVYYYSIFVQTDLQIHPSKFILSENLIGPIAFSSSSGVLKNESLVESQKKEPALKSKFESIQKSRYKESAKKQTTQEKAKTEIDNDIEKVERVIRSFYLKGNYYETLNQLSQFFSSGSISAKSMAKYYSGLASFRLGKFPEAASFFEDQLVKKAYSKQANFWYQRAKEHIQ